MFESLYASLLEIKFQFIIVASMTTDDTPIILLKTV
jgi:hypothetical protein